MKQIQVPATMATLARDDRQAWYSAQGFSWFTTCRLSDHTSATNVSEIARKLAGRVVTLDDFGNFLTVG